MARTSISFILLACCATLALAAATHAQAKNRERVIYTFRGTGDGIYPATKLIGDDAGNLYGSTLTSVYKVTDRGKFSALHVFRGGPEGTDPNGVVRDEAGNIYGTTRFDGEGGEGAAYRLAPDGTVTVLHAFGGGSDGANPISELVRDGDGNLYGVTNRGGAHDAGTVFRIAPDGSETILHAFTGGDDGGYPAAGLAMGQDGMLYGTTQGGKFQDGDIFRISPDGAETVLHDFNGADGFLPWATPIFDADGNLYGTTAAGGAHNKGTVFRLSPDGTLKDLYAFTGGADGSGLQGGVIRDAEGNLYGGTYEGGAFGKGTIFKVTPKGREKVLYSFTGGADGWNPSAAPVIGSNGRLIGTTGYGGFCTGSTNGCGVVYSVRQ